MTTTDRRRMITLVLVATVTVMSTMIIAPALPGMAHAFADTPNAELLVKLTMTVPAVAIALLAPVAGWIIDRYGRLPTLYASLALFGAAGIAGYWLDGLYAILASRVLLGIGIGGALTTAQALAGDYFDAAGRTRFAGMQSAVMSFMAMLLVGAAGVIADSSWRGPFLLYLFGWLWIPLVAFNLDEPRRSRDDHATRHDTVPKAFPRAELAFAYALAFVATVAFYMVAAQMPFLLAERGVTSGLQTGVAVGLVQLFSAFGAAAYFRLKRRVSFPGVFAVAFTLMATGYGLIGALHSYVAVLIGAMIAGVGVGLFFPNSILWTLTIAPPAMRGRCAGGMSASLNLGQFASPIVMHPIVAAVGLGAGFGIAAGALFCAAAALSLSRR